MKRVGRVERFAQADKTDQVMALEALAEAGVEVEQAASVHKVSYKSRLSEQVEQWVEEEENTQAGTQPCEEASHVEVHNHSCVAVVVGNPDERGDMLGVAAPSYLSCTASYEEDNLDI